ncbi:hypothetical protein [Zhaonella formicivorans]|jgi:hypothetical protein|uniref:hypothetical protein n=1 Tax=Zhaonella formicivorans TaxID=2528593 RepID=UPI0010D07C06|nr:hypothetical protein [Zhaonella formicivorans]
MSDVCKSRNCFYYDPDKDVCKENLQPDNPECPEYFEQIAGVVCSKCDFCDNEATAKVKVGLQCMIAPDAQGKKETACFCVCDKCLEERKWQDVQEMNQVS